MARLQEIQPGDPEPGSIFGSGSDYDDDDPGSDYLPELFTALPILRDALSTDTSQKQEPPWTSASRS